MDNKKKIIILSGISLALLGCTAIRPVKSRNDIVENFDIKKYMGTWYEIARLDFKWENNLSHVTANYTLNRDGSVKVINKGYSEKDKMEKTSIGKAKLIANSNKGALKVSFFEPFYSAYNIVKLDKDYKFALIFGRNSNYMWILSREKKIPENIKLAYLEYANQNGFDTSKLVWTDQK